MIPRRSAPETEPRAVARTNGVSPRRSAPETEPRAAARTNGASPRRSAPETEPRAAARTNGVAGRLTRHWANQRPRRYSLLAEVRGKGVLQPPSLSSLQETTRRWN